MQWGGGVSTSKLIGHVPASHKSVRAMNRKCRIQEEQRGKIVIKEIIKE